MSADRRACLEDNLLLKALRGSDRELIRPHLEPVSYARGATIFMAGSPVTHITFPCRHAVATLLIATRDGHSAETATIGHEGAVGGVVSQGHVPASTHAVAPNRRADAAHRSVHPARSEAALRDRARPLRPLLRLPAGAGVAILACNALHPIEQRCLRGF